MEKMEERGQVSWRRVADSFEVHSPITDGSMEQSQNWNSPFENAGVDGKLSSFSSMLQSGGFLAIVNALQQTTSKDGAFGKALGVLGTELQGLVGATSVTKLNSTQVFTGSPPLKLTFTAHFRAIRDAASEVGQPLDMLTAWALPRKLAPEGTLLNVAQGGGAVRSVFASDAPPIVAMQYADMLFMPMVIEHITRPLTMPRDKDGRGIGTSVQVTLSSLTALDKADWSAVRFR